MMKNKPRKKDYLRKNTENVLGKNIKVVLSQDNENNSVTYF